VKRALLTVLLVFVWADPAAGTSGQGVAGTGSGVLLLPPFTGDRVTIVLDAQGRFDVTHLDKAGQEFARLAGAVTCLEVKGSTAFMTGTIDGGHAPDVVGDPRGQILPITIADRGSNDLAGLAPPSPLTPPCAPVPLDTIIDEGGFTVS
jgi:hypothetical protein